MRRWAVLLAVMGAVACGGGRSDLSDLADLPDGAGADQSDISDPSDESDRLDVSDLSDLSDLSDQSDHGGEVTAPAQVGDKCGSDAECGGLESGKCLDFPGGYCVVEGCTEGSCPDGSDCITVSQGASETNYCMKTCQFDGDCPPVYICHPDVSVCWYEPGTAHSPVGGPCFADEDCKDMGAVCYPEVYANEPTGFVGGYCVVFDCTETSCPPDSGCITVGEDGTKACLPLCTTDAECRQGYSCQDPGACFPFCAADVECPGGYDCAEAEEICIGQGYLCSAANPMGWCPEGVYCLEGTCQPFEFECTDTTFEPNESKDAAVKVTPGEFKVPVQQGLQVCVNDSDWFSLTVPKGSSGTLGIWFLHELGDLDLCAYDAAGKLLGCRYEMEDYPVSWRGNDWNDEFLSALALGGERTVYFKADGYKGIPNDYTLYAWTTAWADGLDCTQSFPFAECKGCGSGCVKEDFKAGLMQFPFADPSDPYVGDGYMLEHSSGYRWVRRETAMLVRYAIHEVQEKFPGTTGLGLMDMCQIDGITPGFDVGNPRHPASTHDEGGNIDVAYYQTDGENNGGVVCDGNGGSNNGYYCTSVANHIVDLPRTAYFLAKLADSPRFRVVGVDQLLAPLILAQLKQQADAGWISAASYNKLKNGALAYGDGWPFHFHHMHVSLLWWSERGHRPDGPIGCGYRMPGDGTWEGYLLGAKP